ncbi:MAG TPA: aminotransferase class I/II-fold pyridoxal phosphate-dependent enzyme [Candidatus Krumholzibacteria bacterium]|nr:aminotransferase class I/II-fold pyridoxal phosphate-dependent enzyme [Candidatus Krumholzibacteria bacterium]
MIPPDRRSHASRYLEWAKHRPDARYNLARSGVPRLDMARLGLTLADVIRVEPYEDGWLPVMERIAARHGLAASDVVTTHACSLANHLVFAAFVENGDDVVIETPVYEPLLRLADYFGARTVALPRHEANAWQLDPDEVRRAITPRTTLVVLSNLHNPTGAHDPDATLTAVAAAAANVGAHVLVDEVYLEFLYARGVRTAARLAPNVVTTASMTKVYGLDALRFGWVLAEAGIAERIRRLNDLFDGNTAHPSARIAYHALGMADPLIDEANELLARNLARVDEFIGSEPALSWARPEAGTVGLVRVTGPDASQLATHLLNQHSVAVVPGEFFGCPAYIRVGWCLPSAELTAALDAFRTGLRTFR